MKQAYKTAVTGCIYICYVGILGPVSIWFFSSSFVVRHFLKIYMILTLTCRNEKCIINIKRLQVA